VQLGNGVGSVFQLQQGGVFQRVEAHVGLRSGWVGSRHWLPFYLEGREESALPPPPLSVGHTQPATASHQLSSGSCSTSEQSHGQVCNFGTTARSALAPATTAIGRWFTSHGWNAPAPDSCRHPSLTSAPSRPGRRRAATCLPRTAGERG